MLPNSVMRSAVIDLMMAENAKWYRFLGRFWRKRRLGKLSDDALLVQARGSSPVLSMLTLQILQWSDASLAGKDPAYVRSLLTLLLEAQSSLAYSRSSAPYSSGSSDQAMLSG